MNTKARAMSETTNEFQNADGSRLIIRKSSRSTNGELLEMEATYPPQSPQPPLHYHPNQEEHFEVLRGTFRTHVGGVEKVYDTGETFVVPQNTPHWMCNISDEEGALLWQVRPALKTQSFFETMWGLEADGLTFDDGTPPLLHLAVILREYDKEFRASSPPYWVQRILFSIMAPIGKLKGYRAKYEKYSPSES